MKEIIYFSAAVLSFSSALQAQDINKFDSNGKKHGRWIVYLDRNWKKCDVTKGIYKRYTTYHHGTNLYPMGTCGGKGYRLEGEISETSFPLVLDGTYTWYDKKRRISSVHTFKNGEYIECKEYYTNGNVSQHFDYTKKYKDQPNSWLVTIFDKSGAARHSSYFCQDENGRYPYTRG